MGYIDRSRRELAELGIDTTYVIANSESGDHCYVIDANPRLRAYHVPGALNKPTALRLTGTRYNDYEDALLAIVAEYHPNPHRLLSDRKANDTATD